MTAPMHDGPCPICGSMENVRVRPRQVWKQIDCKARVPLGTHYAQDAKFGPMTSCMECFRQALHTERLLVGQARWDAGSGARRAAEERRLRQEEEERRWETETRSTGCLGCRFGHFRKDVRGTYRAMGECRRRAPLCYKDSDGEMVTYWPDVKPDDSCGEREVEEVTDAEPR